MLIPSATILKHLKSAGISVNRVLHIGAHDCQEAPFYRDLGCKDTVWIDALDEKVRQARQRSIPNVYKAVITDSDDAEITFHVSNNEQSSSVLELGTHREEHPDVYYTQSIQERTVKLDTFLKREGIDPAFEFWNIDIQGAELLALRGGEEALKHVKALYLEVNERQLYKDCPLITELDAHLLARGFRRIETAMTHHGWGDALYLRTPRILMLVLASDDGTLYSGLQATWKLYMESNPYIDCYFIKDREDQAETLILEGRSLYIKTYKGYANNDSLWIKTLKAFQYFEPVLDRYDYVFRPNLSSFIRFDKYLEFCCNLPRRALYSGQINTDYGIQYASGCGFTLSTDLVKRLLASPPDHFVIDDLTVGKAMRDWGIPIIPASRHTIQPDNLDIPDETSLPRLRALLKNPGNVFHFRVRTGDIGRLERDLQIHQALHQRFYCDKTQLVFFCNKHYGGYGDRLIGMATAITLARVLEAPLTFQWEPEFMALCRAQPSQVATLHLNLINERRSEVLETQNLRDLWCNQTVNLSANIPVDHLLWSNPHFSLGEYQAEAIRSFGEVMPRLGLPPVPLKYEFGVQIRCGDTYCMPHAAAEQYIPETEWPAFAERVKAHLISRGAQGSIYLTSDTYKIYPVFKALNDGALQFVTIDRGVDIHFDFDNSTGKYKEIVADHLELQSCRRILTGLRSNFGTTAAYCSTHCEELILYDRDFAAFKTRSQLVLKEFSDEADRLSRVPN